MDQCWNLRHEMGQYCPEEETDVRRAPLYPRWSKEKEAKCAELDSVSDENRWYAWGKNTNTFSDLRSVRMVYKKQESAGEAGRIEYSVRTRKVYRASRSRPGPSLVLPQEPQSTLGTQLSRARFTLKGLVQPPHQVQLINGISKDRHSQELLGFSLPRCNDILVSALSSPFLATGTTGLAQLR